MKQQVSGSRRISVFFYGLFMDTGLLLAKGIRPKNIRRASLDGFALRIGQRATLLPSLNSHVYGMVMDLTHIEIDRLYSEASVGAYRPEAVLADLEDGTHVPALCFNLPKHRILKRRTQIMRTNCKNSGVDSDFLPPT